jgi:hypothetical protein
VEVDDAVGEGFGGEELEADGAMARLDVAEPLKRAGQAPPLRQTALRVSGLGYRVTRPATASGTQKACLRRSDRQLP